MRYPTQILSLPVVAIVSAIGQLSSAQAVTLPYKQHLEQNIDQHQVGYLDVTSIRIG